MRWLVLGLAGGLVACSAVAEQQPPEKIDFFAIMEKTAGVRRGVGSLMIPIPLDEKAPVGVRMGIRLTVQSGEFAGEHDFAMGTIKLPDRGFFAAALAFNDMVQGKQLTCTPVGGKNPEGLPFAACFTSDYQEVATTLIRRGLVEFVPGTGEATTLNEEQADAQEEARRKGLGIWAAKKYQETEWREDLKAYAPFLTALLTALVTVLFGFWTVRQGFKNVIRGHERNAELAIRRDELLRAEEAKAVAGGLMGELTIIQATIGVAAKSVEDWATDRAATAAYADTEVKSPVTPFQTTFLAAVAARLDRLPSEVSMGVIAAYSRVNDFNAYVERFAEAKAAEVPSVCEDLRNLLAVIPNAVTDALTALRTMLIATSSFQRRFD